MGSHSEPRVFDETAYMRRLADLEKPVAEDDAMWLPARPDPGPPPDLPASKPVKMPTPRSKEEQAALAAEYWASTGQPATQILDQFPAGQTTEVLAGRAWVVPGLLSPAECEQLIQQGEAEGLKEVNPNTGSLGLRNNRRTDNWNRADLSALLAARLPESLLGPVEASAPYTSVRGIHPNWRVACYSPGQTFPAHYDQADSVQVQHKARVRQRFTSSHTLLIYLTPRGERFTGGATRLFTSGSYTENTLDIALPQGAGLVFQQRSLLHAGLPVITGEKYIAQAGLLRAEPQDVLAPLQTFKYGPGLKANTYNGYEI